MHTSLPKFDKYDTRTSTTTSQQQVDASTASESNLHSVKEPNTVPPSVLKQTLAHLVQLVHRPSVTPNDAGCQQYLSRVLNKLGMTVESFEIEGVSNLIAKIGQGETRIAFAGHTDVVPALNVEQWQADPFSLTLDGDKVIGRGVAGMKGGIAAMLTAFEQALPSLNLEIFTFYFLITSDKEGDAEYGTQAIMERLKESNEIPHYCIIGEPTSQNQIGDVVKVGRRGSISGEIIIHGIQGHVAYPSETNNAAHRAVMLGRWLTELSWDEGTSDFPGSQLQITGINTGFWTDNMIPGKCSVQFNIRYSRKQNQDDIIKRISDGLMQMKQLTADIQVHWSRPCIPYFTASEQSLEDHHPKINELPDANIVKLDLIAETERAVFDELKTFPRLSVSGGISDGRFVAAMGSQVIELGLPDHSLHKTNEYVLQKDIFELTNVYRSLLIHLMSKF